MTAVSFLLAAVMTFYAVDRLLNGAGNAIRYNAFADTLAASYEQAAAVTDEDEEASDPEETFVYSTVALDLNMHGYDTFEAVLTKSDGEKVRGLGYTDWTYISQTDGVEHYKAGFISYSGEPFYGASDYGTAKISEYIEESDPEEWGLKYAFELKLKEEVWADHYIAFGRYVTYAVDGYRITYISAENTPENYITELGYLYDYDKNEVVYDPDLGAKFEKSGYTLASCPDYEKLIETYRSLINYQDQNGVTVDSVTFTVLDVSAIKEYVLHGQDETFLGISAEQIAFVESQVNNTQYYYVDGVTGQLSVLDTSDVIVDDSATIWNILNLVLNAAMIVAGILLCVTTVWTGVGFGLGLSMIGGGLVGIATQYFQEEIGQLFNNVLGPQITQGIGAATSISMGGVTIRIGTKLFGKTGWGTFAGIMFILLGASLATFGASEFTELLFDYNFYKEWFGLSDSLYANLYKALGYAATVVIVSYSVISKFYQKYSEKKARIAAEEAAKALELKREMEELQRQLEETNNAELLEKIKSLREELIKKTTYPDPKNKTWKMVESRDNFNGTTDGLTKEELIKLDGNAYIVNRFDENKWVQVSNGVIKFEGKMPNAHAYIEGIGTSIYSKKGKMQAFDKIYADKLNDNRDMIPEKIKLKVGDGKVRAKDIKNFRDSFEYVWHEDIRGRVMLIPSEFNNAGICRGIPHIGANALYSTNNARAMLIYNTIKELEKLGVKF